MRIIIVTGAASSSVGPRLHLVQDLGHEVLTLDALTYAANPISLVPLKGDNRHRFEEADICDHDRVSGLFADFRPDAVMHLAAESHVRPLDHRSGRLRADQRRRHPGDAGGRPRPLERPLRRGQGRLPLPPRLHRRVYGSLPPGAFFTEESRYDPRSPYSASKAASDHLARAWHETYACRWC